MGPMHILLTVVLRGRQQVTFTSLAPGTYNVRIRDAAHITCEIVLILHLLLLNLLSLLQTVGSTAVTCYGSNDGIITITSPTGGYGTYEYSIDGGSSWQAGGSFGALPWLLQCSD